MIRSALLVVFVAVMAVPAMAADNTWLGVDSTWQNNANWSLEIFPPSDITTDVALLSGDSTLVAQPTTYVETDPLLPVAGVAGFKFLSGGWTVTVAGTHQIGAQGVYVADGVGQVSFNHPPTSPVSHSWMLVTADQNWYVGSGSTLTTSGQLGVDVTGANLTKTGAGTWQFSPSPDSTTLPVRAGCTLTIQEGRMEIKTAGYGGITTYAANSAVVVGQASGPAATLVCTGTADNELMRGPGNYTINATGTVDMGTTGNDRIDGLTINGGALMLGAGKPFSIGRLSGSSDSLGSLTMAGGSITGNPTFTYPGAMQLAGPSITSNAASTTASISPMILWRGGTGAGIIPPMIHTVTVADGPAAVDMDIQGGLINYTGGTDPAGKDDQFVKAGSGTLSVEGAINWGGTMTLNEGTLQFNGAATRTQAFNMTNVVVNDGAILSGTGTVRLVGGASITVNGGGTISPGASVGTLSTTAGGSVLMGGVAPALPAKLLNEIDATGTDLLAMAGTLALDNNGGTTTLQVSLLSNFIPTNVDVYTIAEGFSSVTGEFVQGTGYTNNGRKDLGNGGWEGVITYDNTGKTITLSNLVLRGDTDSDGNVAFDDYQLLEQGFGTGTTWAQGDFDGSGTVTFADYQILEANFGHVTPEPASLSLLILGGLALIRRRR